MAPRARPREPRRVRDRALSFDSVRDLSYTESVLRRIALGLAAAALALGLVACGGVASTLDPVAAAAERSADAGSVRVRIDASFSSAGVGGSIEAEGVFDEDEGEMTVDASNLVENLNAPSGLGGLGAFDGRLKLILAKEDGRQVVYLGMPALASLIPGGKSWIRADVEEAAKQTGGEFGKLLDLTNQSPAETLDLIGGAGAVVNAGTDTIDGDDVTHYRATVDLVHVLEQ
jgi:hypothetical protein